MRKKKILACTLDMMLPNDIFFGCKYSLWNGLIVLAYHRVLDVPETNAFEYDMDLVSASIDEFDHQMSYISRYMHPVSEKDLVAVIYEGKTLPKRAVMVTFDDGFDDNYLHAFPILKKYSVPAIMFISTSYVGGKEPIWFDWLASLFMSATTDIIQIPDLDKKYVRGDTSLNRHHFHDLIIRLRAIPNNRLLAILDYLKHEYEPCMRHINTSHSRFMSWDQIVEMSQSQIDIGSHTVTHPILSQLAEHEISSEIIESKRTIEARINKPVISLSYPTGMESSFTEKVVDIVKHAGYKLAFTYQHGYNTIPIPDVFRMKRVHVERHVSRAYFNSMMKFPMVFRD